jgi:Predicted periplasmic lipoprotein (DUF2279)
LVDFFSLDDRLKNRIAGPLVFFCLLVTSMTSTAQGIFLPPSATYQPDRLKTVVISEVATGIAISAGLYFLWYRKHPRSHFHFFNDNGEWLQMDKIGHATTAYNIGTIQYDLMRWCGVNNDQSIVIGGLTAIGYMSIVEIFDGFSSKWGFSNGDMLANIFGAALFAAQQKGWNQQRISLKWSFHGSIYAKYYPAELGSNFFPRMLKDYNGQTYWLSFNISSFLPVNSGFPYWLNMSFGYGAEGMIGARTNPASVNGQPIPDFPRYRKFYFAPDANLFSIPTNSSFYNAAAYLTKFSKIPAPTLEWSKLKGFHFYPIYY